MDEVGLDVVAHPRFRPVRDEYDVALAVRDIDLAAGEGVHAEFGDCLSEQIGASGNRLPLLQFHKELERVRSLSSLCVPAAHEQLRRR
jgi:hypothetical protein